MLKHDSLTLQVKFLLVRYNALYHNNTLVTNLDTLIHYSLLQQLITTISFPQRKFLPLPISQPWDKKHGAEKIFFSLPFAPWEGSPEEQAFSFNWEDYLGTFYLQFAWEPCGANPTLSGVMGKPLFFLLSPQQRAGHQDKASLLQGGKEDGRRSAR